jgi:hypothetical protein
MTKDTMRALIISTLALLIPSAPAFGWGCEGRQIVALIARAHLTSAASAAIDRLLAEYPADPALNHYCKSADAMVDTAAWADEVRNTEKTGPWHYIDIPLTEKQPGSLAAWCPAITPPLIMVPPVAPVPVTPAAGTKDHPGCVTNAIEYHWAILLDTSRSDADRTTALRYLIHFVGDMHQPLHSSDNNDQGGNCTAIQFFDQQRPANLHSIWDTLLIQHELTSKKETPADYARQLDRQFADRWPAWGTLPVDPTAWAWEGNRVARMITYGDLKPAIPLEKPRVQTADGQAVCTAEREKVAALHIAIGDPYFDAAIPVVGEQLAKAGYRLADLLNRSF